MCELEVVDAFRHDDWSAECPKCNELVELGDQTQAERYVEDDCECECGYKFRVSWNSVNG